MQHTTCNWYVQWLLVVGSCAAACRPPGGRAEAVALVDLRAGDGCAIVNLHGLQQLAALRSLLPRLQPRSLRIELQVEDSCSSRSGTRRGTLKALVAADQTCLHPPLILGILGNGRTESFEASYEITKNFDIPHVLPYSIGLEVNTKKNVYFISAYPLLHHTKAIKSLLMEMGLRKVILAFENSKITSLKADHMMDTLKGSFCFVRSFSFSHASDIGQQLVAGSDEELLLVLLENNSLFEGLPKVLRHYEKEVIISVGKIGLYHPFSTVPKEVYILEMTSKVHHENLTSSYDKEMLKALEEQTSKHCLDVTDGQDRFCYEFMKQKKETDWSVGPLAKGLELLGRAGERAASCGLACKDTWFSGAEPSDFTPAFSVYLAKNFSLAKVGRIDGQSLLVEEGYSLRGRPTGDASCEETVRVTLPPPSTTLAYIPEDVFQELGTYQLAGVASGAAAGALLLVGLVLFLLYRTVRSDRSDSSASIRTALSE